MRVSIPTVLFLFLLAMGLGVQSLAGAGADCPGYGRPGHNPALAEADRAHHPDRASASEPADARRSDGKSDCCGGDADQCGMQSCSGGAAAPCTDESLQLPPAAGQLPPFPAESAVPGCSRLQRPPIFA